MNLRGRLGSTRITKRGLGCNADSSTNFSSLKTVGRHLNRKLDQAPDARLTDEENAGQRSKRGAPYGVSCGQEIARLMARISHKMIPHCYRHHGNLCAEEGMHTRSQQIFFGGGETRMQMRRLQRLGGQ